MLNYNMFSGIFGREAPPLDEPSAVPVREALNQLEGELISIDRTLGKQFGIFKSSVKEFTDKVRQDKQTFNASRAQKMPSNELSVPLEKEALDVTPVTGGSLYYGHNYGSKKMSIKKHHDNMFAFSERNGIPKYI